MAGHRETPRQKMIGMMYLVLTALLALQVSSALIYKFQALNTSLEKTVMSVEADNQERQYAIDEQIKKRGNKAKEVKLGLEAREIRLKTQAMLGYIDGIKKELIEKTGGYSEDGGFKGANEETEVEVIMIGASEKSGKAYELKQKLDAYTTYMNQFAKHPFEPLAKDAKDDPTLKNNSEQKNKNYAHLNFGQTPMVAALAVLSETASKIVNMENKVMVGIAGKIDLDDYKFDRLKPVVKPQSDFVVAGTKYQAEMFMVATSSSLKPIMQMGGQNIEVNSDGIGALSFVAAGGNYKPDGTMKKVWKGNITMKKPDGGDTTYTVEHEYTVVKPVIQVQSGIVKSLYRNCGNKLTVSVPALGASYNPKFTVSGGQMINGSRPGEVTIVPKDARVKLIVSNNGTALGTEDFGVQLIPLPSIEVKVNNRKVKPIEGIAHNEARDMTVRVIPERGFKEALPADARYYISEGNVMLANGKKSKGAFPIKGQSFSLNSIASEMKPGDRIIVEVTKVKRINFRNETEEVSIPVFYETINLN